jgi:hypothetical protein
MNKILTQWAVLTCDTQWAVLTCDTNNYPLQIIISYYWNTHHITEAEVISILPVNDKGTDNSKYVNRFTNWAVMLPNAPCF